MTSNSTSSATSAHSLQDVAVMSESSRVSGSSVGVELGCVPASSPEKSTLAGFSGSLLSTFGLLSTCSEKSLAALGSLWSTSGLLRRSVVSGSSLTTSKLLKDCLSARGSNSGWASVSSLMSISELLAGVSSGLGMWSTTGLLTASAIGDSLRSTFEPLAVEAISFGNSF